MKPVYSLLSVGLITLLLFALYQSFHYSNYALSIGKVTDIETIRQVETTDQHGNQDTLTTQRLSILLLSGEHKEQCLTLINHYDHSQISTQRYHIGNVLFMDINDTDFTQSSIIETKRDSFLIMFILLTVLLILFVANYHGMILLIVFAINMSVLIGLLMWYKEANSSLLLIASLLLTPIFIAVSLLLFSGWSVKTRIAMTASLITTYSTFIIGAVVITLLNHKGLHYESMELITRPGPIIFFTSLLMGSLGAIMDVSMTISTALTEVVTNKPDVTTLELKQSATRIGQEVMGPMINIMFFSYLSGSIPLMLIFLSNQMALTYTFSLSISLELARALVSSIGIVLTIPITTFMTTYFYKGREQEHVS